MRHRRAAGGLVAALALAGGRAANFVEFNWGLPGIPGSVDQVQAGVDASEGVPFDLAGMFEFSGKHDGKLFLNPATGERQG